VWVDASGLAYRFWLISHVIDEPTEYGGVGGKLCHTAEKSTHTNNSTQYRMYVSRGSRYAKPSAPTPFALTRIFVVYARWRLYESQCFHK